MKINKHIFLSAFVGGIILFSMSIISWKTVYWGGFIVKNFENEKEVEMVMRKNAPVNGVYVMPNITDPKEVADQLPVIFTGINHEGKRPLTLVLVSSFIAKFFMALFATWLLLHHVGHMPYLKRVGFFLLMGCLVAVASKASFLIKGYYSLDFALYSIGAILVQWFLAGLAMAGIAKHE